LRQYIYTVPLFAFFLGWLWDSSANYYLEEKGQRFSVRAVAGLVLMTICVMAGSGGIILHAFKLI